MTTLDVSLEQAKAQYLADLGKLPSNGAPNWLNQIHATGAARFRQTPLPNSRMEEWRQTNIGPIVNTPYRSLVAPTAHGLGRKDIERSFYGAGAWTELVFVDGYYAPDLSLTPELPTGVFAGALADGIEGTGLSVVETHLNRYLAERNAFTSLNSAFIQDGALVRIGRNAVVEHPIHVLFVTSKRPPDAAAHIRNLIVLETGSQARVLTSYVSLTDDSNYLNNVVEEVVLGPNSQLHYYKLVEEGAAGNHLGTTEIVQDRDSRLHSFVMSMTGKIVRNQVCVKLDGDGASAQLVGLYLNDGERLIDNPLSITHVKPNCYSRIMYKGILDGNSHAVYAGKVYVHQEAQKTDSNQLTQNLMLSDNATIHAKPQLEIYADDVKCTHGATIGSPPAPIVFYFQSRGIDEAKARAMLTYGFAEEVVSEIDISELSERLGEYVYQKYSP
ncbi:MAG: Fe-S cluster assembly protein SufD [Candidatus Hydrogenedentes bacterium]|nr:Fe-S cluster assembly protein SufD [Candidatus Hydrogenedentota bacterium]